MKELSIEQKAKRYDETLKAAVVAHKDEDRHLKAALERIFPELKESEDEKIREALIDYFDDANKADENPLQSYGIHTDKAIAWLEKQDKQNPCESCEEARLNCQNFPCERKKNFDSANKVKPKFHKGQWITNGDYTWQIVDVTELDYILQSQEGNKVDDTISHVDEQFHVFSIQDAKGGDVLACESGWTCIFKKLNHNSFGGLLFDSYCFIDRTGWFCDGAEGHTLDERINGKIYPATKEQRDTLLKSMADAGYTFDFEKKELKKL